MGAQDDIATAGGRSSGGLARSQGRGAAGHVPIARLDGRLVLVVTPGRRREHELYRASRAGHLTGRSYEDIIIDDLETRRWIVSKLTGIHAHYIDLMRRRSHAAPTPAEVTGIWQLLMAEAMELREYERVAS